MYNVTWRVTGVVCAVCDVLCHVWDFLCHVFDAACHLIDVLCLRVLCYLSYVYDVLFRGINVLFHAFDTHIYICTMFSCLVCEVICLVFSVV